MPDDVMRVIRVPIGSLASRLYHAEHELLRAEKQVESLLESLYGKFSDYEYGPDGIDVFDAIDSSPATHALFRAGFPAVRCHAHPRSKFAKCACPIHHDMLRG